MPTFLDLKSKYHILKQYMTDLFDRSFIIYNSQSGHFILFNFYR